MIDIDDYDYIIKDYLNGDKDFNIVKKIKAFIVKYYDGSLSIPDFDDETYDMRLSVRYGDNILNENQRDYFANLITIAKNSYYLDMVKDQKSYRFIIDYINKLNTYDRIKNIKEDFRNGQISDWDDKSLDKFLSRLMEGYTFNDGIVRYFSKSDKEYLIKTYNFYNKQTHLYWELYNVYNEWLYVYPREYLFGNIKKAKSYLREEISYVKDLDEDQKEYLRLLEELKEYNLLSDADFNNLSTILVETYNNERHKRTYTEEYKRQRYTKIILTIIDTDCKNLNSFAYQNNLDIEEINDAINYIKDNDTKLYDKYLEKMNNTRNQRYAIILNNVKSLANAIDSGEFKLLDYFNYTKMNPDELKKFLNQQRGLFSKEEYHTLIVFLAKNKQSFRSSEKIITSEKLSIDGHVVTEEERDAILNYLHQNKIPCSIKIYGQALRRYLNKELTIEKSKTK